MKDHLPIAVRQHFHSGGGGLISNVPDYLSLITWLITDGTAPSGARILKSSTVEMMFEDTLEAKQAACLDKPWVTTLPEVINSAEILPG